MARRMVERRVERVYEQSHWDERLRAGAYELLVPIQRARVRPAKEAEGKMPGEGTRQARGA